MKLKTFLLPIFTALPVFTLPIFVALPIFAFPIFAAVLSALSAAADSSPRETEISAAWCEKNGGITEFRLLDKSRIDCYLPEMEYAAEFDWGYKDAPYTCIGQARYYAAETGMNPLCILIRRDGQPQKEFRKYTRKALIGGGADIRCITIRGERIDCLTGEIRKP